MEGERSQITLDGISLWGVIRAWCSHDTSHRPISPSPSPSGALQPPSPWQRGRSAAPCVCACAHVRKRSSSSELNCGRTWYSLDVVPSQIPACCYYTVCKIRLILTDKGKNASIWHCKIYIGQMIKGSHITKNVFYCLKNIAKFGDFSHKPTQRH